MIHLFNSDILVIGAVTAGSSAGIRARVAGLSVMIVGKSSFPRLRIGESLILQCNGPLRELGVGPKIENTGFIKKFGARFLNSPGRLWRRFKVFLLVCRLQPHLPRVARGDLKLGVHAFA